MPGSFLSPSAGIQCPCYRKPRLGCLGDGTVREALKMRCHVKEDQGGLLDSWNQGPGGDSVKNPPANTGDRRDMDGAPGVGNGNTLQCSCLENSMLWSEEPGERQSTASQSRTQLNTHIHTPRPEACVREAFFHQPSLVQPPAEYVHTSDKTTNNCNK